MKVMVQVGSDTDVEAEVSVAQREQHEAPAEYADAWFEYLEEAGLYE